jgi:hypothetical protein
MDEHDTKSKDKQNFDDKRPFPEIKKQVKREENKEYHHGDQGRVGPDAFQQVPFQELDEGRLHSAAGTFDPEPALPRTGRLVLFKPLDER